MDDKLRDLRDKARQACRRTSAAAAGTAYAARTQAARLKDTAALKLRLTELEGERSRQLRQVGELVYATHTGLFTGTEELLEQLRAVDAVCGQIAEAERELARLQGARLCPRCGAAAESADLFCRQCGVKL